ncbi:hypothetical protein [Kitasatospora cathayae]|uniref:DUF397 domain-containing protein n=1 Tax=Kitasatospora cathayae TaxID=3004092 RepID=A0ABY7QGQ1_9ACTN|nr:hypothetical protein [Kitasatospora sp. HUAS 3-15]WBP91910.1 hypothetical protein O1G21_03720 [Kitasatospora sp. HUAS 3-15]
MHTNTAWDFLLPGVVKPHTEQRREVPGAGTLTRVPPCRATAPPASPSSAACGSAARASSPPALRPFAGDPLARFAALVDKAAQ